MDILQVLKEKYAITSPVDQSSSWGYSESAWPEYLESPLWEAANHVSPTSDAPVGWRPYPVDKHTKTGAMRRWSFVSRGSTASLKTLWWGWPFDATGKKLQLREREESTWKQFCATENGVSVRGSSLKQANGELYRQRHPIFKSENGGRWAMGAHGFHVPAVYVSTCAHHRVTGPTLNEKWL